LGDRSYAQFNLAVRKLTRRLDALGARAVCRTGEGDAQASLAHMTALLPWLREELLPALLRRYPLAGPLRRIAPFCLPPCLYRVELVQSPGGGTEKDDEAAEEGRWTPECEVARLAERRLLSAPGRQQEREVILLLFQVRPDLRWAPGDSACLLPPSPRDLVERLLRRLGRRGDELVQLQPQGEEAVASGVLADCFARPVRLRWLLERRLDLVAPPRRMAFALLAQLARDERERERLQRLASPEALDELEEYAYRERRGLPEVLDDFPSVDLRALPLARLVEMLSPLSPRAFSVCSAWRLEPGRLELCVAVLRWRTPFGRARCGLASSWLASLELGRSVQLALRPGLARLMPDPLASPALFVGPGTGCAIFRAFLQERLALAREREKEEAEEAHGDGAGKRAPWWLLFGCRQRELDFLFEEEWRRFETLGLLRLEVCFSRQEPPERVTHRLQRPELAAELWRQVLAKPDGFVYVSGSARQMPADVRAALQRVAESAGGLSEERARLFLADLARSHRYQEETWP
jgi:sulfite reductase alpha subunit-like flavoprotein